MNILKKEITHRPNSLYKIIFRGDFKIFNVIFEYVEEDIKYLKPKLRIYEFQKNSLHHIIIYNILCGSLFNIKIFTSKLYPIQVVENDIIYEPENTFAISNISKEYEFMEKLLKNIIKNKNGSVVIFLGNYLNGNEKDFMNIDKLRELSNDYINNNGRILMLLGQKELEFLHFIQNKGEYSIRPPEYKEFFLLAETKQEDIVNFLEDRLISVKLGDVLFSNGLIESNLINKCYHRRPILNKKIQFQKFESGKIREYFTKLRKKQDINTLVLGNMNKSLENNDNPLNKFYIFGIENEIKTFLCLQEEKINIYNYKDNKSETYRNKWKMKIIYY